MSSEAVHPPAPHPELIAARRSVAHASDKLRAIQDEGLRLKPFVDRDEIPQPDALDTLCEAARSNGLYKRYLCEDIDHVVGESLAGRKALVSKRPRAEDARTMSQDRAPRRSRATLIVRRASEVPPEKIEWVWRGRIAIGKHTTIAGDPGTGKSQVMIAIIAAVTTGGQLPCGEGHARLGSVVVLAAEDGVRDTMVPRLLAAGANLKRVHFVIATRPEDGKADRTFNLQADLDLLEKKIGEIGDVCLVCIDPISSYLGKVDSHKNAELRAVLEPIGTMAERALVAILSVTHFSKGGAGTPTKALYGFIGSIAFTAAPRVAFVVTEDPDNKDRRFLLHGKNNLARPTQGLAFRLAQRFVGENRDIEASYVVWDSEPVATTADQALGVTGNDEPSAKDDAIEFLRDVLASGPVTVNELEREARSVGLLGEAHRISQSKPFRSARDILGIRPYQLKGQKAGGWLWALRRRQMPLETIGHLTGRGHLTVRPGICTGIVPLMIPTRSLTIPTPT
jgi:putative DNA primase/helicase